MLNSSYSVFFGNKKDNAMLKSFIAGYSIGNLAGQQIDALL